MDDWDNAESNAVAPEFHIVDHISVTTLQPAGIAQTFILLPDMLDRLSQGFRLLASLV